MADKDLDAEWAEAERERIRCCYKVKGRHDPLERQCLNAGTYRLGRYYCHVHIEQCFRQSVPPPPPEPTPKRTAGMSDHLPAALKLAERYGSAAMALKAVHLDKEPQTEICTWACLLGLALEELREQS